GGRDRCRSSPIGQAACDARRSPPGGVRGLSADGRGGAVGHRPHPMSNPLDTPPSALRPEHLYKAVGLLLLVLFLYAHLAALSQVLLIVYAAAILGVAFNVVVGLLPGHRKGMSAAL